MPRTLIYNPSTSTDYTRLAAKAVNSTKAAKIDYQTCAKPYTTQL